MPTTTSPFTFAPVVVTRGRKFRGKAFYLGQDSSRSVAYGVECWSSKLWDPIAKRYVYANPDFCDKDESVTEAEVAAAKLEYVTHIINNTVEWCRSQKPNASDEEIKQFARNVLRKHHREMMDDINRVLPDQSNLHDEITRTLKWASTLTTKACFMYGRWCAGGNPLSLERQQSIAFRALEKRGLTSRPDFKEMWDMLTV
jgi:hypothetical protein